MSTHPPEGKSSAPKDETQRLALLLDLSRGFNRHLDLDTLLPLVLRRCMEVLHAEGCSLLLLDEETNEFYFPATSSVSEGVAARLRGVRFPADKGIAGEALRTGKAIRVSDAGSDDRFYPGVDAATGERTAELLCAPLRSHDGVLGVLEVINRIGGSFDNDDLEFLDALANSVAIAVENAHHMGALRHSANQLEQEVTGLRRERVHNNLFPQITGNSAALQRVLSLMQSAVDSSIAVLLEGETGVGKEVIANAIHAKSPRAGAPFVTVNCGALPAALLESELFGFARGAFTGATRDKLGLFEVADRGTLFLDEIGDTPPELQVKLLRVLQEGELRRLGETQSRHVDVRVISATNRDLEAEVRANHFREDLFYRLSVFPIRVPALRERREDIPVLTSVLLQRIAERLERNVGALTAQALDHLVQHDWPGNIRELENELERAVALTSRDSAITHENLSERVLRSAEHHPGTRTRGSAARGSNLKQARHAFEREFVATVLEQHRGNATRAAQELGISRQMLQRKIRDWDLRNPSKTPDRR